MEYELCTRDGNVAAWEEGRRGTVEECQEGCAWTEGCGVAGVGAH